ncbi:MAG: hypothetical protein J7K88_06750 [Candidatus Fermentibacteraceae bacterium]|nr:hypothetical protein [Candidatus Fermentibacteraceae bacterium]
MKTSELNDDTVKLLRIIAVSVGILMIAGALFANFIGFSSDTGISHNQVAFLISGVALIVFGILGRKFPGLYKGLALLLLNLLVTIMLLEFASIILVKLIDQDRFDIRERKIEEGHLDLTENSVVLGMYAPFVVWRSNPALNSDSVTVDNDGYRITPGVSAESDAYRVFLLGGSAMWGTNVSDSGTIGAHLQQLLTEYRSYQPTSVSNMAQVGHSSTQEVIELMLQLRDGSIPDLVIFYDGFNDVWGAYEAGRAGTHHSERAIAARVEGSPEALNIIPPFEAILRGTNTWLLISSIRQNSSQPESRLEMLETYFTMGIDKDILAESVVSTYLGNCAIVEALAKQYGFEYIFVWQPSVWYGEKPLSEFEESIVEGGFDFFLAGGDPAFKSLYTTTYSIFEESAVDSTHYLSFAHIFDDMSETVYNDYAGVHVDSWANRIVAEELLAAITELNQN